MSRAAAKLPSVATPSVGGVSVKRHVLDLEAAKFAWITRRLGQRLHRWMRNTPEMIQGFQIEWTAQGPISKPILDEHGQPVMVPCLPDGEWRDSYKLYGQSLLGLLKEQRARAMLTAKTGAPPLTEEEYEASLRELVADTLRKMPQGELDELLAARKRVDVIDQVEVPDADP